jgi:hypothetical protein
MKYNSLVDNTRMDRVRWGGKYSAEIKLQA